MTRANCRGSIYEGKECMFYLHPSRFNSKVFNTSNGSNHSVWCRLYDDHCTREMMGHCGLNRVYKLHIRITADARMIKTIESPEDLEIPLRDFVFKKLGGYGELPVVSICYDELEDSFNDPYGCGQREALDLMRAIPNPQPWIQELIKNLEEEMSFE